MLDLSKKKYAGVGDSYIVEIVCPLETLNLSVIQRGNANYRSLHGTSTRLGWGQLCALEYGEMVQIDDDVEALEQVMERFEPPVALPTTVAEVEAIQNMRFEPETTTLTDWFEHADGTMKTRVLPQFKHLFGNSASSSFLRTFLCHFGSKSSESRTLTLDCMV
ncbi:hypothetical protein V7S43_010812 [Phytophthora oleae]|uniref:HECT domain-containing protein n=1 Tax=Phytophthora oleae TaxID=2107226 RepID=A0ABD3FAX4_9STRA